MVKVFVFSLSFLGKDNNGESFFFRSLFAKDNNSESFWFFSIFGQGYQWWKLLFFLGHFWPRIPTVKALFFLGHFWSRLPTVKLFVFLGQFWPRIPTVKVLVGLVHFWPRISTVKAFVLSWSFLVKVTNGKSFVLHPWTFLAKFTFIGHFGYEYQWWRLCLWFEILIKLWHPSLPDANSRLLEATAGTPLCNQKFELREETPGMGLQVRIYSYTSRQSVGNKVRVSCIPEWNVLIAKTGYLHRIVAFIVDLYHFQLHISLQRSIKCAAHRKVAVPLTLWEPAYNIFVLRFRPKKQQFSVALPLP